MAKNSQNTRRDFLKTTGTMVGVTSIAGCNSLGNGNDRSDSQGKETNRSGSNNTDIGTSTPTYELQSSDLKYDLTDLAASEANQHDKLYLEENYSSKLEVVAFKNGKEVDLEIQSQVHLEDEDAEKVAITDDGSVPEYAVRDGQELIVRTKIDGEIIEDTISVNKILPHDYDVILNIGEEVSLEEFMDSLDDVTLVEGGNHGRKVYLETQQGTQVEVTEYGTVPRDKIGEIEEGQELKLGTETGGELTDSATVVALNKTPRGAFIIDARLIDDGETVLHHWDTPYRFDAEIGDPETVTDDNTYEVTRERFLNQRAETRDEIAGDQLITEEDLATWRDYFGDEEDEFSRTEKVEAYLGGLNLAMEGGGPYEGSGANDNSVNLEEAMFEHSPYESVFIGGFTNPKEPDVPSAGDGDGFEVDSKLAFVDGDWYQGTDDFGFQHISKVNENPMAQENSGITAVSVLAEFDRGNTELLDYNDADEIVESTVTSPVTLNGNMTELELSDDISWNALNQIRENSGWTETMAPIELATAIQIDTEGGKLVGVENDGSGNPQIKFH